jgi:hypothetical protein
MKIEIYGATSLQRKRIQFYCDKLLPDNVLSDDLTQFLSEHGIVLHLWPGKTKGYFSRFGIHIFRSREFGWKNHRKSGKRGFFRADQVFIHELMHAVWHLGDLGDWFKQEVYGLHAKCPTKYFNYSDAYHHPPEWFCDQFPRALLFKQTCYKPLLRFIKKSYFDGKLPDIKLEKGEKP